MSVGEAAETAQAFLSEARNSPGPVTRNLATYLCLYVHPPCDPEKAVKQTRKEQIIVLPHP